MQKVHQEAVRLHVLEVEHQVEGFVLFIDVFERGFRLHHWGFAHHKAVIVREHIFSEFCQVFLDMRAVKVVLHAGGGRQRKAIGQSFFFGNEGDDILAEAVHTQVEPKAHNVLDFVAHLRVIHVEVRLLFGKDMQVVFAGFLVAFPGAAFHQRQPVVGRSFAVFASALAPDVVVMVAAVGVDALNKPAVFIGGMVDNQIHNHLQTQGVRLIQHLFKLGKRAVVRVNVFIVGDVIAIVGVGARIQRAKPNAVYA